MPLTVNEELAQKVIAWAVETARCAVALPSRQERDDYLAERRRERSVPLPTLVFLGGTHFYKRRKQRDTSNLLSPVWLWI
jgi:hypothetical protein